MGEPFDQLLAKHGDVYRSGGDNTDLGAILGLVDLILRNVGILSERRPENERVDMNAAGTDEYVVGAPLDGLDQGEQRAARAEFVVRNGDVRQLIADQRQGTPEQ